MLEYTGWDTMAVLNQRQEKIERDRQRAVADRVLRDQFAAAALTGLLSQCAAEDRDVAETAAAAIRYADAMLRERGNHIADAGKMAETPHKTQDCPPSTPQVPRKYPASPQADRLTEWERHGSHRWGLGVAADLYDLECRVAVLEKANHDAAPAATAHTDADRNRTDKAAIRPSEGTGDTHKPVAWGVEDDRGLQYALHPTPGHASHMARTASVGLGQVVPLYRSPTLTDAEREAMSFAYDMLCQRARELQAVHAMESSRRCVEASRALQGLFERMGGRQ